MSPKYKGQYHFGRHYRNWGIWKCDYCENGTTSSRHIKDVMTYEEAVRETYRLNGWGEPKYIKKIA